MKIELAADKAAKNAAGGAGESSGDLVSQTNEQSVISAFP